MSIKVQLDTKGWERKSKQIERKLRTVKPVLKTVARGEIRDAQTRIRTTKQDPDGRRWAPWSYATMQSRARQGRLRGGLLYLTGFLYNSFWSRVTSNKMEVKNTAPYAEYLQEGTSKMPARPFLGFSDGSVKRIKTLFKKHLGI